MELRAVTREEKPLLFNLLQKYLYELSLYYQDDMDGEGNFPYAHFEDYFSGDPSRKALFFCEEGQIVGFALLNAASFFEDEPSDHVIAEFCVLPKYRRKGRAARAVQLLFAASPGVWEVKFHSRNRAAAELWSSPLLHCQKICFPNDNEVILTYCV